MQELFTTLTQSHPLTFDAVSAGITLAIGLAWLVSGLGRPAVSRLVWGLAYAAVLGLCLLWQAGGQAGAPALGLCALGLLGAGLAAVEAACRALGVVEADAARCHRVLVGLSFFWGAALALGMITAG